MVAELAAIAVLLLASAAELIHARRVGRVAQLVFGPSGRPRRWARLAPSLRVLALGGTTWGLTTLLFLPPKVHRIEAVKPEELRHLVLLLDVSPSMRLEDAGPTKKQPRKKRVADLLQSFFERSPSLAKISVVAVYNGAKPVVIDTLDMEVIGNILEDLPMHYAFEVGETRLFDGLEEAAAISRAWPPASASLLVLSDGDTVPATGMPKLPASISQVLVVGVGDSRAGSFIDGRQSRQDVSTLRQIAARLGGIYHNGNEKHISTETLRIVTEQTRAGSLEQLSRREYALLACLLGSLVYAGLPSLLHLLGTSWRPGVRIDKSAAKQSGFDAAESEKKLGRRPAEAIT